MTVKEYHTKEAAPQNPWVQTPLRESYALSEAAGWYGHTALQSKHFYTPLVLLSSLKAKQF
jgi:hypothetical protein